MKTCILAAGVLILATLVRSDPARLPMRLAETGLYRAGQPDVIDPVNRAFSPQYPLWSDGLSKRRWVYLPPGSSIDAADDSAWRFPVGTKLWKEFSLGSRKIETRIFWKVSATHWEFGSYVWNDEGTEAVLAPVEGVPGVIEVAPRRRHTIPSRSDCATCHGSKAPGPLGFTALQLSTDRDPNAIHGEPLPEGSLTLRELVIEGRLAGARADLLERPPRIRASDEATRTVLGYMAANCSMCHDGSGEIAAAAPVIPQRALLEDADAIVRAMIRHPTRWQQPGVPDGQSVLIAPGAPEASALLARMHSRAPSSQMPPLGTVLRDQEAVEAVRRWIQSGIRPQ